MTHSRYPQIQNPPSTQQLTYINGDALDATKAEYLPASQIPNHWYLTFEPRN